jgi:hypothetical protein
MGAIASSGRPDALDLFHKVMLASASIPGAFPPVYFNVEVDGKQYDEMHVDGGTIVEVFGYGPTLFEESAHAERLRAEGCSIYVRSLSTLMKAHSWMDIYRLYDAAEDDGVDFNYVSIPDNYEAHAKEPFDPVEMKRLFDLGFEMASPGYKWQKAPPGYRGGEDWTWTP